MKKLDFALLVVHLALHARDDEIPEDPIYISRVTEDGSFSQIFDVIRDGCARLNRELSAADLQRLADLLYPMSEFLEKRKALGLDAKDATQYTQEERCVDKTISLEALLAGLCEVIPVT